MTHSWYQVAAMCFGYLSAAIIAAIVLLALRKYLADRSLWRRVQRNLPQAGAAGTLRVLSGGNRRLTPGQEILVPYEGTMGSGFSCDVCIPQRRVHMRAAFFWVEGDDLHLVPLHKDGFLADGTPAEPGDEAVLEDGAILNIGELKLVFRPRGGTRRFLMEDEPYVTPARRGKAQKGRGEGIGAPGRGEMRREKKRWAEKFPGEDEEQKAGGKPAGRKTRR